MEQGEMMGQISKSKYCVSVPEGQSGDWKISKFTVTKEEADLEHLRAIFNPQRPYRVCPPGEYTRLTCKGTIIMSDTPDEIRDHMPMVYAAKGDILITGLGLGMVLQACLRKPEVAHATVIELSPDVINLVGNHYQQMFGDRLTIINVDAMTWKPPKGTHYGAVWHDIWEHICGDCLPSMRTLRNRFRKVSDWQGIWSYEYAMQSHRQTLALIRRHYS